jgi:hypothetical protein
MAKLTLLEIVQDIMNDMSSDEVNSISDTEESVQVAQIVKTTYFEMMGRRDWAHLSKFTTLNSIGDSAKPTHLGTPDNLIRLDWFKYNKKLTGDTRNRYKDLEYLSPDAFIIKTNDRNLDETNVTEVTDYDGAKFQVLNDRQPIYYTSFDDNFIVLDSYDSSLESTVQGLNTQVKIYTIPTWTVADDFVPDLPMEAFPALLAEAKSVASFKLDEEADQKAEQQSERQQKRLSLNGWSINGGIKLPDYGRRIPRTTSGTHFNREQT